MAEEEIIDLTEETSSEADDDQERDQTSSEVGEPTLDNVSLARLLAAIESVNEERLRTVVTRLVETLPAAGAALFRDLVVPVNGGQGPAQFVQRWEICANCGEEFDAAKEREDGECVYHSGELECDEEAFPDHDEDCHGPMDTKENRRDYPEGFVWTCCDQRTRAVGCEEDVHVPGGRKKRRRF